MPHNSQSQTLLRPVIGSDADFLYRLYASTRAEEMTLVDWSDAQKREFLQMQFRAQSKHYAEYYPQASRDVIELEGEPVGRFYVDESESEYRIIDIALLPEYRRLGIGRYYLQGLIARASEQGREVTIHVEHNNPAMSLYQRLGFVREEDKGVYWFMRCSPAAQEKTAS